MMPSRSRNKTISFELWDVSSSFWILSRSWAFFSTNIWLKVCTCLVDYLPSNCFWLSLFCVDFPSFCWLLWLNYPSSSSVSSWFYLSLINASMSLLSWSISSMSSFCFKIHACWWCNEGVCDKLNWNRHCGHFTTTDYEWIWCF